MNRCRTRNQAQRMSTQGMTVRKLPSEFSCGASCEELRMQLFFLRHVQHHLFKLASTDAELNDLLQRVIEHGLLVEGSEEQIELKNHKVEIRALLSAYNAKYRLKIADRSTFPRKELIQMAQSEFDPFQMLPPPTPCEYVDESLAWWCWGSYDRAEEWLGHGFFWRSQEDDHTELLDNMAGSSLNDFDVLEDGFMKLRQAKVLVADYDLLRRDFEEDLAELSEAEIDAWILENSAYLSAGQVGRLRPGGDHHTLLGINEAEHGVDSFVDGAKRRAGIRNRSGGRAVTFFVGDGEYALSGVGTEGGSERSFVRARMFNVKGVGTHKAANFGSDAKNTGLLSLADALREMAMQRLLQRIAELEQAAWGTCQTYAIVDTGLQYAQGQRNPATGWEGERCVLMVRQRHSRAFCHYNGYNFSGVLLMTGEPHPAASMSSGHALQLREALIKYGVSSEALPTTLLRADGVRPHDAEALANLDGCWNIQCEAAVSHFMDFSDFYVLPDSRLPAAWRMSEGALRDAFCLETEVARRAAIASPPLRLRLFGTDNVQEATRLFEARVAALARKDEVRDAASRVVEVAAGQFQVLPGPPKFCQCWFMQLDDSEVSTWALEEGRGCTGPQLLARIDAWLPTSRLSPAE